MADGPFLDMAGVKAFKDGCDNSYDKKSFLSNRSSRMSTLDVDFGGTAESHRNSIGVFSSGATNSPGVDGHVINLSWDNSSWGTQFAVQDGSAPNAFIRTVTSVNDETPVWSKWAKVCTSLNYDSVIPAISTDSIKALF